MMKEDFFKKNGSDKKIKQITAIRQELESIKKENNATVRQIWDLDNELQSAPEEKQPELVNEKKRLSEEIESKGYIKKIEALKKQIYQLEMDVFGESSILSSSPTSYEINPGRR